MSDESIQISPESEKPAPPAAPEPEDFTGRITRTLIAVAAGLIAALICLYAEAAAAAAGGARSIIFPLLVLVACILIQKHIFMLLKLHPERLQKKDWFYQAFMTFSFWFVSWTILLSNQAGMTA